MNDDTQTDGHSTKRRAYDLPNELVERVVEFQKAKGLPSEVEAVRRLLDMALKGRDTIETLVGRYLAALSVPGTEPGEAAGLVLSGHPLVRQIAFEDDGIEFHFQMANRPVEEVSVKGKKEIHIRDHGGGYGNSREYVYDDAARPGKRLKWVSGAPSLDDDEIPF